MIEGVYRMPAVIVAGVGFDFSFAGKFSFQVTAVMGWSASIFVSPIAIDRITLGRFTTDYNVASDNI